MGIIACTADLFPEHIERLKAAGHEVRLSKRAGNESLAPILADADALICLLTDRIESEALSHAPRLEIVANVAVGYENIDLAAAEERGILVTNTPDVLTESTADHTFALLLAAARRIAEADVAVRNAEFPSWGLQQPLIGIDVHGKTLGIVGLGRIGAAVARRGHHGFGMSVLYYSRSPKPDLETELGAVQVPFEELLKQSDFVCVHVPLTSDTKHMFNAAAFAWMKPTAILVNVARGAIIDEAALVNALEERAIAGAGLDVFEQEPAVPPGLLELREHVVLAPHLGSATEETRRAMAGIAIGNVLAVLDGKPPLTPVP
ncbi:D-glycerate dehydrogenase [Candidatus Bipolaricaulota bacterium]|jgi:glyoxylate reductase|nr:D-glycerate dehydrogenase [Candidatus Bipolaricaulota bacterium]